MQSVLTLIVIILVIVATAAWAIWPKLRRTIHQKLAMVINEVMQQREHDVSLALARSATTIQPLGWEQSSVRFGLP